MLGELSSDEIEALLGTEWVARLGCHAEGVTYVVPITYAYDGQAIYGHSAEGLKLRMLRANPQVCVEVDKVENLANWRSVIAWGRFEELHDEAAWKALQRLVARFESTMTIATATPTQGPALPHQAGSAATTAIVYRVVLDRKTGRFERT